MKVITYFCDRCRVAYANEADIQYISIVTSGNEYVLRTPLFEYSKTWCRKCLAETGVGKLSEEARQKILKKSPPPPLSFEELLRELIADEIVKGSNQ